jgi:magnesium chelatase family protein
MLAQRFAGLLPPLTESQALESAAVLSVCGAFVPQRWGQRMLRTPHHSASSAALVGGGVRRQIRRDASRFSTTGAHYVRPTG